jgi:hypothetical protein
MIKGTEIELLGQTSINPRQLGILEIYEISLEAQLAFSIVLCILAVPA